MGLSGCPSAVTLRQRIDSLGHSVEPILVEESAKLVQAKAPALTPIQTSCGPFLPLDIDVSPFDNSKKQKEKVSRTYKGCDSYAPIFGYPGAEGYLVNAWRKPLYHVLSLDPTQMSLNRLRTHFFR